MTGEEDIIKEFVGRWEKSFRPPRPYGGKNGKKWLISGVWSSYMAWWLYEYFGVVLEIGITDRGKTQRKLDAGIWLKKEDARPFAEGGARVQLKKESPERMMDLALEWEWNVVRKGKKRFCKKGGDFQKILSVPARAGLAIIQTKKEKNPEKIIEDIEKFYKSNKEDNRSVGIIEIRRTISSRDECEFKCFFHDLVKNSVKPRPIETAAPLSYPRGQQDAY